MFINIESLVWGKMERENLRFVIEISEVYNLSQNMENQRNVYESYRNVYFQQMHICCLIILFIHINILQYK
jgi:hypothetical protein